MRMRLKLVKTIIGEKKQLAGFVVQGKDKDMGGFSEEVIEKAHPIEYLIKTNFSNAQIEVRGGKFIEKNNFKINQLPMCIHTVDNNGQSHFIDVDNTVDLVGRYVQDNENIGFRVRFSDGTENDMKYSNILMLCKWFKPGNFTIRTSPKGNMYIAGKKNVMNLDQLPAKNIGKEPEKAPKRMKSAAKAPESKISANLESGFDILDIYKFIADCNGSVIKLPDEKYVAATEGGATEVEGFTSLGIGEVASPKPIFNATKINVNANFKQVGIVPITAMGNTMNITTYVHRQKSIFLNGENYMKRFGIAVSTDRVDDLHKTLGASLALKEIKDNTVIQPLSQVIDAKSLAFFEIDTSKVDLISAKKRKESILTAKQISALCQKQYELKLVNKALGSRGPIIKELKDTLGKDALYEAKGKKLFGIYAMMNTDMLKLLEESGIDVYTGAYTVPSKPIQKKDDDKDKAKTTSTIESVEIEYTLTGYDADKITGKQVVEYAKAGNTAKIPESVIEAVNEVLNIVDLKQRYLTALKLTDQVEAKLAEMNKKLWLHNASMYIEGAKTMIHRHDAKKWEVDETSRVKKGTVYRYTGADVNGLTVKCIGVTIN